MGKELSTWFCRKCGVGYFVRTVFEIAEIAELENNPFPHCPPCGVQLTWLDEDEGGLWASERDQYVSPLAALVFAAMDARGTNIVAVEGLE
jgi:hypothetical protein